MTDRRADGTAVQPRVDAPTDEATTVAVRAQAKLNLRLAILAREVTGYHSIETLFHKIELADDVTVSLAPAGTRNVRCSVDVGPTEQNLAYRAAVAFLDATGSHAGFEIDIAKRIPAGGGLGGGSADAAATLQAMNWLSGTPFSAAQLLTLAATLGADVPFLTSDAIMALAWGRGERFLSIDPLPQRSVALVTPDFRIATRDAYGWAETAWRHGVTHAEEFRYWHLANWDGIVPRATNDFEPVVAARFPDVTRIVHILWGFGAVIAGLTGSGSTMFGIFETPPVAEELERVVGYPVTITRTAQHAESAHRLN